MKKYFFVLMILINFLSVNQNSLWALSQGDTPSSCYYFGYGGNMNTQVLKQLLHTTSAEDLGCYRLDGYEFVYNRAPMQGRQSTGGNIQPQESSSVYGVVWKLSEKELSILDKVESAPTVYQRRILEVVNQQNPEDVRQVIAYIANPEYISATCFPRPYYVKIVTEGAREHNLPEDYINEYLDWSGPWGS